MCVLPGVFYWSPKKVWSTPKMSTSFFPILKHLLLKGFLRSIAHFNKKFLYFPLNRYVEWCDGDIYRDIGNFDLEISVRVVSDMLECVKWEKIYHFHTMPSAIARQKTIFVILSMSLSLSRLILCWFHLLSCFENMLQVYHGKGYKHFKKRKFH